MSVHVGTGRKPANILIVDDVAANLQVLSGMLENRGYVTRPVTSGKMALQAAQNDPPDLILLDITMPGMDGYEVCARLKADEKLKDIPVIFISALHETLDKVKGFGVGAADYVTKPFQFEEVRARVETHLNLRRLQVELERHDLHLQELVEEQKALMLEQLREQMRHEAELNVACEMQRRFLPRTLPKYPRWEFAARYVPTRVVAGDFYDIIPMSAARTCIVLGDVCGKGVPAALQMTRIMSYFRIVAQTRETPDGIMGFVNNLLVTEWSDDTFATAALCMVDNEEPRISFCSAGHMAPYLLRESTGVVEPIPMENGLPLSVEAGASFRTTHLHARAGDSFVLYTDGVTEARNTQGDLFSDDRLLDAMRGHTGSAESLAQRIVEAVQRFSGIDVQEDDLALMVIRCT
jgi:serine phosphatase RsbU (regulator of sigma subunit)